MSEHTLQLNSCILKNADLNRKHAFLGTENYKNRTGEFDFKTLFYDIISTDSATLLYCPKLFNFEDLVNNSEFLIDEIPQKITIRKYSRYDIIKIRATGSKLSIKNAVISESWNIDNFNQARFKSKNCIVTVIKNDELTWITDFVKFHRKHQQLEAIVIFDNGSTDYSLKDLADCLHQTGISDFLIVNANFPYGPILENRNQSLCFLQTALLNIAKIKFFAQANAVLSIDIDELVWRKNKTIFELTQASFFGFVSFKGFWRYPEKNFGKITHQLHCYFDPTDISFHLKYCYSPQKVSRWVSLGVHKLNFKRSRLRDIFNSLVMNNSVGMWHCKAISTNWKYDRNTIKENLIIDDDFFHYFN